MFSNLGTIEHLIQLSKEGKWDELSDMVFVCNYYLHEHDTEYLETCFKLFYDKMPNDKKYKFAVESYVYHRNHLKIVRKAIRGLSKYGKPRLPARIAKKDIITVYRGGIENENQAKFRISWTLSQTRARWFVERWIYEKYVVPKYRRWNTKGKTFMYDTKGEVHLYRAKIEREKILAYTDLFNEKEVMQYGSVFDIQDITPTVIGVCLRERKPQV